MNSGTMNNTAWHDLQNLIKRDIKAEIIHGIQNVISHPAGLTYPRCVGLNVPGDDGDGGHGLKVVTCAAHCTA